MFNVISEIVVDLIGLVFLLFVLNTVVDFLFGFDVAAFLLTLLKSRALGKKGDRDDEDA